jgi:kinesin family protein 12
LYEEVLGANPAGQVAVRASYLEIYNEHVYDLLNPKGPSLPIRWNAEKGFFVENLYVIDCEVLDDCLAILEEGNFNEQIYRIK